MLHNIYNKFRRITTNQVYFPEIDGIRFVAIVLVVLFHIHGYFMAKTALTFADDPAGYGWLNKLLQNGDRGVELFFVLSGFILCLPFAHHYINNGKKVLLKKYYLRRVTRLEPPYLLAITAIFLMQLGMHVHPSSVLLHSWLASMAYAHDIIYHHAPLLTVVAWSLEIEIQFYLLAPIFFSLLSLPRHIRRTILILLMVLLVVLQHYYTPPFLNIYGFGQFFLAGILLADFYVSDTAAALFSRRSLVLPAFTVLLTIMYLPIKDQSVSSDVMFISRLALPFLICLFYYIVMKNPAVKTIFSYRFVPIIGGMCYSIYLLHYTIISVVGRYAIHLHLTRYYLPNFLLQVILLSAPALLLSSIFYLYIERPFMSSKWLDMLMKKDKHKEGVNKIS